MIRDHRFILLALALVLGISSTALTPVRADTIELVADEWCPFNCVPSDSHPGILVEIAQEIFQGAGHSIQYQVIPWSAAIEQSRAGKYAGVIGAIRDDAQDFIFPTEPQSQNTTYFWTRANDTWDFKGLSSLEEVSIGVIQGYHYGAPLDQYIEQYNDRSAKIRVATGNGALRNNINKLLAGKIRAVAEVPAVMDHILRQMKLTGAFRRAGNLEPQNLYIAFSPNRPRSQEFATILSSGMQQLSKRGRIREIFSHYDVDY